MIYNISMAVKKQKGKVNCSDFCNIWRSNIAAGHIIKGSKDGDDKDDGEGKEDGEGKDDGEGKEGKENKDEKKNNVKTKGKGQVGEYTKLNA